MGWRMMGVAMLLLLGACSDGSESSTPSTRSTPAPAPTAETAPPTTEVTTTAPTSTATDALARTAIVDADPFRQVLHDRQDEVYFYGVEIVGPRSRRHVECASEAALSVLSEDRLVEQSVVSADSRLVFDALDSDEREAVVVQLSTSCDLSKTAGFVLGLSEPVFGMCAAEELWLSDELVDLIRWVANGNAAATFDGVARSVAKCQQDHLVDLASSLNSETRELRMAIGRQVATNLWIGGPLTAFEFDCAALSIATSLAEPFLTKFTADSETDFYAFLAKYYDSDLIVRTTSTRLNDVWHSCVPLASVIEQEFGIDLDDVHVTCLNQPRVFELSYTYLGLRFGRATDAEVVDVVTDLAVSRCGLGDAA